MTDRSLTSLFRRLNVQSGTGAADLLDADTLIAAAAGTLRGDRRDDVAMRLSRSDVQTDLVRLLRELAPATAELAHAVGERQIAAHVRGGRQLRHSQGMRNRGGLRWAGLAACLAVALGMVSVHQLRVRSDEAAMAAAMQAASRPDRIFSSVDRIFSGKVEASADVHAGDAVFRSNFNGG